MSIRATIMVKDDTEKYFIYRHSDGCPSYVVPDIEQCMKRHKSLFNAPIAGHFVSQFLGMHFHEKSRCQPYELTGSIHGDESYEYIVSWDKEEKEYKCQEYYK